MTTTTTTAPAVARTRSSAGRVVSAVAVPAAALSAGLAWSAVAAMRSGSAERVAAVVVSRPAIASIGAVLALGAWLHRRGSATPLWLAACALLAWVPAKASGALLLWHGPAGMVALGAAVAIALWPVATAVTATIRSRTPLQQAACACLVSALVYGLAAWRMQPQLPGGDEPHYLVITQSLLLDGDLRIENNHARGDYRAYTQQPLKPDFLKRGTDGQIYSIHAPGLSALVLPAFALAGYPGVVVWLVIVSALGAALAWWTAWRLTGDAGAAWIGWAVVSLTGPYLFESFAVFPDATGAVLVMACTSALVVPGVLATRGGLLAVGACAALLPWLHTRYAVLAAALGAVIAIRIAEQKDARASRLAWFFGLPLVSGIAWLSLFHAIYGTFNPAAPYGGYTQSSLANVPRGLTGLLIDQQFGLLPNAPVYAVALAGAAALWRRHRRLAIELAIVLVPYALAVACYHMWWGGRSAPARFLVPTLLPLALPAALFWSRARATGRAAAGIGLAASVVMAGTLAWTDRGALVFNVRDGYAAWADAVAPLVRLPLALPSLFRGTPLDAWTMAGAWIGVIAAVLLGARNVERARAASGRPLGPDAMCALTGGALLAAVTIAAALGWRVSGAEAVDVGTGLLRVAQRLDAAPARAWRSSAPLSLEPPAEALRNLSIPSADRRQTDPAGPAWMATDVPPGRYEVRATSGLRVTGRLAAFLGRDPMPLADAALRDAGPGVLPWTLDLPAGASSLRIVADADARRSAGTIELRREGSLAVAGRPPGAAARARLGGTPQAWMLDANAFVEPGGFWVRGGAETALVIDGKAPSSELILRAGPVTTTAVVRMGTAQPRTIALAAGTSESVLVNLASPVTVRVGSSAGFRPHDHDPANPDVRWLGVRVELR